MKFHITSLGCTKNTADSEKIANHLVSIGWSWAANPKTADLVMINTCGFINDAKEQSLNTIMEAIKLKHGGLGNLVVFGCLVKRYKEELKEQIPEVDLFFEFFNESSLQELIKLANTKISVGCHASKRYFTPSHIGFLKIAEGCDNRCTYCSIPNIRGNFQSYNETDIIANARELAKSGARELSIIAQDITRYGSENRGYFGLPALVAKLAQIEEIEWIRLHYMHPRGLTPALIDDLYGQQKLLPYFDIPMQHASQKILDAMNRQTSIEHTISLIEHIRAHYTDAAIRSTFIVGFPGETTKDFETLIEFLEAYPLDKVGAFMYSPEENTPAFAMKPQVQAKTKQSRLDRLMTLQQLIAEERNRQYIGKNLEIIIDKVHKNKAIGRTKYDAWEVDNITTIQNIQNRQPGDIITGKIIKTNAYDLIAEPI